MAERAETEIQANSALLCPRPHLPVRVNQGRGIRVAGGFSIFTDFLIGLDKFLICHPGKDGFDYASFNCQRASKGQNHTRSSADEWAHCRSRLRAQGCRFCFRRQRRRAATALVRPDEYFFSRVDTYH